MSNQVITIILLIMFMRLTVELKPIESGTIQIPIPIPTEYQLDLQSDKNTLQEAQAIVSITQVDVKQGLKFDFTYQLDKENSILTFKFKISNQSLISNLSLDYLICYQANVDIINMTDFQWHYPWPLPPSGVYDTLLLYLNGFSSLNYTGNVTYSYIKGEYQMYTIHYLCGDGTHKGWGNNYILYTAVFTKKNPCQNCVALQKSHLKDDQNLGDKSRMFFGFRGYTGNRFKGRFERKNKQAVFNFDKEASEFNESLQYMQYGLVGIPYNEQHILVDQRTYPEYVQDSNYLLLLMVLLINILLLILILIGCKYWKIYKLSQNTSMQFKNTTKQFQQLNQQKSQIMDNQPSQLQNK